MCLDPIQVIVFVKVSTVRTRDQVLGALGADERPDGLLDGISLEESVFAVRACVATRAVSVAVPGLATCLAKVVLEAMRAVLLLAAVKALRPAR